MTDKKTPLTTESAKNTDTQAPTKKTAKVTSKVTAKEVSTKETADNNKSKVSKLALVAIVIALGSTAVHYFWQQQQSLLLTIKLTEQIDNKNTATFNQYQAQIKQALTEQQKTFARQLQQVTTQANNNNHAKITKLDAMVIQLERKVKQRQPSDWLLHEAEYLIRIASRTLWLEQDTAAAIGLLKNADVRLADLNDPTFLPVRELVHLDIKSLELMPTLQTDEIVLTLMAMNKQVAELPLAMVDVNANTDKNNTELSNDINDWQANLSKTWEKFLDDFIRVRQRTGMIKPLISPEQQQHLRQNLNLKVQLALWAASERKADIYQQALTDIQQWITEFFDLEDGTNQHFLQSLTNLQTKRVSYDYPNKLKSLTALRIELRNQSFEPEQSSPLPKQLDGAKETHPETQPNAVKAEPKKPSPLPKQNDAETTPTEQQSDAIKTEPEKSLPKQPDVQPNVEGII
jgi:uroporphyrin-3 C-methyltransferase